MYILSIGYIGMLCHISETKPTDKESCISTVLLYVLYSLVGVLAAALLFVLCCFCVCFFWRPRDKVIHEQAPPPQPPVIIHESRNRKDPETIRIVERDPVYHPATFAVPRAWVERSATNNLHGNVEF